MSRQLWRRRNRICGKEKQDSRGRADSHSRPSDLNKKVIRSWQGYTVYLVPDVLGAVASSLCEIYL
jgi:hypothetical protein